MHQKFAFIQVQIKIYIIYIQQINAIKTIFLLLKTDHRLYSSRQRKFICNNVLEPIKKYL